jgi:hypothetical protein
METNSDANNDEYICKKCNKKYKNRDGLWKHNTKHHGNKNNQFITKYNHSLKTNNHIDNPNIINNSFHENTVNYNCNKCNKSFTCYQNRWRHQKTCKITNKDEEPNDNQNKIINILIEQIKEQKEKIEEQEQQNQEIKKTLMELLNKNCKVHPGSKNHEALDFV